VSTSWNQSTWTRSVDERVTSTNPLLVKRISRWSTEPELAVQVGRRGLRDGIGLAPTKSHKLRHGGATHLPLPPPTQSAGAVSYADASRVRAPPVGPSEPRAMVAFWPYKPGLLSSILRRGTTSERACGPRSDSYQAAVLVRLEALGRGPRSLVRAAARHADAGEFDPPGPHCLF